MVSNISWPNKAQSATLITVNLDAEYFWLQLEAEAINKPKTLSMGQYGMTHGLQRLLDVFDDYKIKATFFIPGIVAQTYSDYMEKIVEKGHEISCHGYKHENMSLLTPDEQKECISKGVELIEKYCGVKPKGFRAPEGDLTLKTLEIVHSLGMAYSSDLHDDDRPYWMDVNDKKDQLLQIPVQWAMTDFPYLAFNYRPAFPAGQGRIANYSGMLSNWKDEFLGYHERGLCYVLQIDPQTMGNPGRTAVLEEFLDYVNDLKNTWFATGSEVVEWMRDKDYENKNN